MVPGIEFVSPITHGRLEKVGSTQRDDAGNIFDVIDDIPVLVIERNYAENFGFQWNAFPRTQIDNTERHDSSRRFWAETGWNATEMGGRRILEVGSGAGRFTDVVLRESGGLLASVDISNAVYTNKINNQSYITEHRLFLAQASIYALPFRSGYFDFVFCLGVLQHTPDFRRSVRELYAKVAPGGELVIDFYPVRGWWTKISAKYMLRPFLKRFESRSLLKLIRAYAPPMILTYKILERIGLGVLTRFIPICDISRTLPVGLNKSELLEAVVLDTFDMYSPEYDHPQRISDVSKWLSDCGAQVTFADFISYGKNKEAATVRCIKPPEVIS